MTKYILILNGPNLNLLGLREPEIYGRETLDSILQNLRTLYQSQVELRDLQSNCEGTLIDALQKAGYDDNCIGVVLNAGAYTHTSLAIADAIRSIVTPVIEVHLSNTAAREAIRHTSLIGPACLGSIAGFGADSYRLAVEALLHRDV